MTDNCREMGDLTLCLPGWRFLVSAALHLPQARVRQSKSRNKETKNWGFRGAFPAPATSPSGQLRRDCPFPEPAYTVQTVHSLR